MIDRYVLSNHKEVLEKYFKAAFKDEFIPKLMPLRPKSYLSLLSTV